MDTNNHFGEVWFGSKKTAVMEYHQHHWGCRDKVSAPLLGGPLKKHPGEPNRATVIGTWGVSMIIGSWGYCPGMNSRDVNPLKNSQKSTVLASQLKRPRDPV